MKVKLIYSFHVFCILLFIARLSVSINVLGNIDNVIREAVIESDEITTGVSFIEDEFENNIEAYNENIENNIDKPSNNDENNRNNMYETWLLITIMFVLIIILPLIILMIIGKIKFLNIGNDDSFN